MTKFVVGQPQTTAVPRIAVDAGLKPGIHRFSLVVINERGLRSAPDEVEVEVRALTIHREPPAKRARKPVAKKVPRSKHEHPDP